MLDNILSKGGMGTAVILAWLYQGNRPLLRTIIMASIISLALREWKRVVIIFLGCGTFPHE